MRGEKYLILVLVLVAVMPFVIAATSCGSYSYVSYYDFENNNTLDSAAKNNGTNYGATFVDGQVGEALYFDGSDFVNVPDSSDLDITDEITLSAWVRGGSNQNPSESVYVLAKPGAYELQVYGPSSGSQVVFRIRNSSNTGFHTLYTGVSVLNYQWQRVTATYDGDKMRVYVNSSLVATSASIGDTIYASAYDLTIGAYAYNYGKFNGTIDEVKIYDCALECVINADCDDSDTNTVDTCEWNNDCKHTPPNDQLFIYQGNYGKLSKSLGDKESSIERLSRLIARNDMVVFTHGFTLGPANWTNGKCVDSAYPLMPDLMKRIREIKPDIKIFAYVSGPVDNQYGSGNGTLENCPGGVCTDFMKWVNLWRGMEGNYSGVTIDGIFIDYAQPVYMGSSVRDNIFSHVKNVNKLIMANLGHPDVTSDTDLEWIDDSAYFDNSEDSVLFEGYYIGLGSPDISDTIIASEKANDLGIKFSALVQEALNVNVSCGSSDMKAAYNMSRYYGGEYFTYQSGDLGLQTTMWKYCANLLCSAGKYIKWASDYSLSPFFDHFHLDWDTGQKACCDGPYYQVNAFNECVTNSTWYDSDGIAVNVDDAGWNEKRNDTYAAPYTYGWLDCDDSTYAINYCNSSDVCPGGLVYAGELGVGEYTNMTDQACCGDDPHEYYIVNGGNSACCDEATDQVNSSDDCY